jgi:hypothetical protein
MTADQCCAASDVKIYSPEASSAERGRERLRTAIREIYCEEAIGDRSTLPDELIHPRLTATQRQKIPRISRVRSSLAVVGSGTLRKGGCTWTL